MTVGPGHQQTVGISVTSRKHQHQLEKPLPGKRCTRFAAFLCLCLMCTVRATSQEKEMTPKVSIHVKNICLGELIRLLRKQVQFQFIYSEAGSPPSRITLDLDQAPLTTILDKALQHTGWEYMLSNGLVIIKPASAAMAVNMDRMPATSPVLRIAGTVTDDEDRPMFKVNVVDQETGKGSWTDESGAFTLETTSGNKVLFSFIGFESQLIATDMQSPAMHIRMKLRQQSVNEVIVTGYQQIKAWEITGAVAKVKGDALRIPGVNRIDQALQGRVPGATVTFPSGGVGAAPRIRIRGTSTLQGNREPIWVVDGIVREPPFPARAENQPENLSFTDRAAIQAGLSIYGNAITGLNPDDIEEITVLKDAAATAIYGSRAANGVIVISTRKGRPGPPQFNIRSDITVTDKPSYHNLNRMNAVERIALSKEIFDKGIIYPDDRIPPVGYEGALLRLLDKSIDQQTFNREVTQMEQQNTNWFDVLFRNAVSANSHVSMSGGNARAAWYGSLGRTDENGNARGNYMNRTSALFKTELKLLKFVDAAVNISSASYRVHGFFDGLNPYEYAFNTNRALRSDESYYASIGEAYQPGDFSYNQPLLHFNFLNELAHTGNNSRSNSVNAIFSLNTRLGKSLRWESIYALAYDVTINRRYADERSFAAALIRGSDYDPATASGNTYISKVDSIRQKTHTWRNTLYYFLSAGRHGQHEVNIMAGTEARKNIYEGLSSSYVRNPNSLGGNEPDRIHSIFNFLSFYGSFSYAYRQKYIADFNLRTDASNRFAADSRHRFNPVWSAGVRWNMKEESWMQQLAWLNNLSLKAAFGYQGNTVDFISPYLLVTQVTPGADPYTGQHYLGIKNLPYTDLRWERTHSFNAGIDVALFGKLKLTADYYYKISADVILKQRVPEEYGVTDSYVNGGEIHNKGVESALTWTVSNNRQLHWDVQLVAGFNDNRVFDTRANARMVSLVNSNAIVNGKPVGGMWSFPYAGLSPKDGQPLFRYLDVDKDLDRLLHNTATDYLLYSGNTEPPFSGGFNTTVKYKRFSLAASFNVQLGYKVRLNPLMQAGADGYYRPPAPDKNVSRELTYRWLQPGDERYTNVPSIYSFEYYPIMYSIGKYFGDLSLSKNGNTLYRYDLYNYSDLQSVSADNLRCNYITAGYEMDHKMMRWLPARCRMVLSFSVNNAFVIKNKRLKGQDPEIRSMSATESSATLPRYRSFVVSVNLKM
ncbi:MAG TPA: SusC/RagA family TonB-linked outer membrane protein [Chitinophaga sp.]|uniref:SusC/RagA family TonB-linked outer membrane protein n=1 Tax=Chitinophaga sp. TaxID=1869181 RepID=UPI002C3E9F36|nr:SusC/RagA family TonB-linked outer membrane protein [Chitinophaga sp.]HVI44200.1 SusC/RagA family TonB-linked outer membrane protein [Chitinophaga sp.]